MGFKKLLIAVNMLFLFPLIWGQNFTYFNIPLGVNEKIIFSMDNNKHKGPLELHRVRDNNTVWKCSVPFSGTISLSEEYQVPENAYMIQGDILSFPLTTIDKKLKISRIQVTVNINDGTILWTKNIPAGLYQPYFYGTIDESSIFVHNLHPTSGSHLQSLDKSSGELLWETEIFTQPSMVLQSDNHLIIHNVFFNRYMVIDKKSRESIKGETSSPVLLWKGGYISTQVDQEGLNIIYNSFSGEHRKLGRVTGIKSISNPFQNIDFFDKRTAIVPVVLYGDQLILIRNGENESLISVDLLKNVEEKWELFTPNNAHVSLIDNWMHTLSNPWEFNKGKLISNSPESSPLYIAKHNLFPLRVSGKNYMNQLLLIDLSKGEIFGKIGLSENLSYMSALIQTSSGWVWRLKDYPKDKEIRYIKLPSKPGDKIYSAKDWTDIYDNETKGMDPFFFLIKDMTPPLNWEELNSENRELLLLDNPDFDDFFIRDR